MNRGLKVMLPIILILGLLIAGCGKASEPSSGTSPKAHDEGIEVGNRAPDFGLYNLEGQYISLSEMLGSLVMLNFWATWCPPCVYEMPYIQQVYDEWLDKGLVVLAINVGESSSQVGQFMQDYGFSFPVLLDTKQVIAQKYNIRGIPTTFFIDKNGVIQEIRPYAFSSKADIEGSLNKIMP